MTKTIILKNIFLGFLSWLIPFAISFLFYSPGGKLMVPYATFKSTIMVVGTISGCYLLYRYFRLVDSNFIGHGLLTGFSWFAINIVLDTVILIPMMKSTFPDYLMSIGIGYFSIPAISITIGHLMERKVKENR